MNAVMKKSKEKHESFSVITVIMLVVLCLYALSMFIVLAWAIMTAFKDNDDFRLNVIGLPKKLVWNFSYIFKMFRIRVKTPTGAAYATMGMMYVNSVLYAVGCAFFKVMVTCITAYMCARFPYKFSKVVYTTVIVAMVMPIVGALPSEISMAQTLGIYDTVWGMWIMKSNFLGMYFLVFYNVFKTFSTGYVEAAKVDGASNMRVLIQIVMPLVMNTIFTVLIIDFIIYWNDYQAPLIYMPSHPTISYGAFRLIFNSKDATGGNNLSTMPYRMTIAILMVLPIMVVFLAFHKRLLGNLTVGGLKG